MKTRFPARPVVIALGATLLVWGVGLRSSTTWSPEGQVGTINPYCRVGTPQLSCVQPNAANTYEDAGAPAWQNIPSEYFFRRALLRGEPRPHWNPYIGSGYPIALDGHNSSLSVTQWFLRHVPGDQGHDIVVFTRFAFWTIAITWLVALFGASTALLVCVALSACLAPYIAIYVDIAFLDADLMSPWFLLILFASARGQLSLRAAALLSVALGLYIGAAPFPQAPFALCFAMGVIALLHAPFTRGRSLLLMTCLGVGVLAVYPSWLPLARNMDQFVSARTVQCIAANNIGWSVFYDHLLHPQLRSDRFVFVTLAGIGTLLFVPKRAWFLPFALIVLGAWEVFGLPHAACSLPVVSGIRFVRHLLPHLQMLFIVGTGIAIASLSHQLALKRAWIVFAAGVVLLALAAANAPPIAAAHYAWSSFWLALALGVLAAMLQFLPLPQSRWRSETARGTLSVGLALLAYTPFLLASNMPIRLFEGGLGAPQMPPLPDEIDPSTPFGVVQKISQAQDRRHFSPSGFLFPNWSQALAIPDLLILYALYPVGYHELNAALFKGWYHDPQHGLIPDRFIHVGSQAAMQTDFQRVLAVHRVSLLTYARRQSLFAASPSPYDKQSCQLLATSRAQNTESYVCPRVGGIGYFPRNVGLVNSREEALGQLTRLSPTEILDTALLGPELDDALASSSVSPELLVGKGSVRSVRRWGDDLIYKLDVERAGTFVIADTFFRGWKATVNGKHVPISRANVNFKALLVPTGNVVLKLHFKPAGL